jgi:hypothetical protein
MTQQDYMHPITPPPELLQLWFEQHHDYSKGINELLIEAVQYGADRELEACVDFVQYEADWDTAEKLRAARRPKPPSLKKQAIVVLEDAKLDAAHYNILLRALEQLPDNE